MIKWIKHDSWIAVYDILGFKERIRDTDQGFQRFSITWDLSELFDRLESDNNNLGQFEYMIISDTIVIFAHDLEPSSYGWFLRLCKNLIEHSITKEFPLRCAISAGTAFTAQARPILIGPAFVEAYEYCEDQDWIGLLLTPSATNAIRQAGLEPLRHDFVVDTLHLRKLPPDDVLAYRFQNGAANFESPLLVHLRQMQHFAPTHAKDKYSRTIEFIQRHYQYY